MILSYFFERIVVMVPVSDGPGVEDVPVLQVHELFMLYSSCSPWSDEHRTPLL